MCKLKLVDVSYRYEKSGRNVLDKMNFEFEAGKIYTVLGKSGAGKTTLLSLLSGLARQTEGKIYCEGTDTAKMDMYKYRSQNVGVVFQSFNLLPTLTALENVVLSMEIAGVRDKNKKETAYEMLKKVGLERDEADRKVLKLSGGQQQRVAIARAVSYAPDIILADEPTGNLDGETQTEIMKIFRRLADEGKCVIIVTHSPEVAKQSDVQLKLGK